MQRQPTFVGTAYILQIESNYSEKNYKRALEELKCDFYEAKLLRAIILYDTKYLAIAKKEFENIQKERPDDMVVEYINRINHELSI